MDAIDLLLQRQSCGKLGEPAPTPEQLAMIQQAALRAPDHARLRPWRFLRVSGDARERLGDIMADLLQQDRPDASEAELHSARAKPLRAPVIVIAVACLQEHPKVPVMEQLLSAGCAMHAMLLAAYAQGLGGIWRTGPIASDTRLHARLGLATGETIVGFLYLGTPSQAVPATIRPDVDAHFSDWPG